MIINTVLVNYLDGNNLVTKTAVNKVKLIKSPDSAIVDVMIYKTNVKKILKIIVINDFTKPIYDISLYSYKNKKYNDDITNIKTLLPGEKGKLVYHVDCELLKSKVCVQYTVNVNKEKNKIYRII